MTKYKKAIKAVLALPVACTVCYGCGQDASDADGQEDRKPLNIIYIMSDDHSYQTISAYGSRLIETPNIDRLADSGIVFTNSFVANSISGPSRACLLTGKHSHKNGFTDNTRTFDGSQQTFPKLLRQAGYETAVIGKWHLTSDPTGFDYWNILVGQGEYYDPVFIDNGERKVIHGYATDITTDIALDWLKNKRDPEKPFCLLLHHKAPHRTWMPDTADLGAFDDTFIPLPENFYDDYEGRPAAAAQEMEIGRDMNLIYDLKMADKEGTVPTGGWLGDYGRELYARLSPEQKAAWDAYYDPIIERFKADSLTGDALTEWKYRRYMRDYLSVIQSLDRNIGRVLDYLMESGLWGNTLVIYTSDQGFYMGEHGWFDKRFMYEESFRTPLLARYPGGFHGEVDAFVQNIDHAPTFLEMAGAPVPDDIQGGSYLSFLRTGKVERGKHWRKSLYYHFYEYPGEHSVRRHYGVRTDRWKLIHFYGDDIDCWELYDLKKDPHEMSNIYGSRSYRRIQKKLHKELRRLQALYDDPVEQELALGNQ
ncbi:MAG TPA: sulfatase [Candidatus Coprenecus pullistercoris]|nr:sulfatase [Candidatus Coprenecus pullistercoris]